MRVLLEIISKPFWLAKTKGFNTYARKFALSTKSIEYKSLKILFFGTDKFSLASLKSLEEWKNTSRNIGTLDVVTSFRALNNPVKEFAKEKGLKLFSFKEIKNQDSLDYHLGLVVSFGHMIPEKLISKFPLGMLNVHGSLLPKYRGAAPIMHAIRNGDKSTGVSIMRIAPKHFDIGEILLQREFPLSETDLMPKIHDDLASEGAKLLIECMNNLSECLRNAKIQNEKEASYAPKIDETFTQVKWDTMTAKDVYNLYRSVYSFKFITTYWRDELIKLKEISLDVTPQTEQNKPGFIKYSYKSKCLKVFCADGNAVNVYILGNNRKNKMSAADFNNGFLSKRPESERVFT
ncbi:methionyl-tRNA formyltransferase, mitochondrial [Culicoides brevitarsis]|uniref:methionyl-tRNA formyltransferase, mitochondrial n=1 Tax=Culicoides brevitarsis TaxID=469753 RepID=UPI00307C26BB